MVEQQTGRVIVMYRLYPAGFSERDGKIQPGLDGPAIVCNYVIHSDDNGSKSRILYCGPDGTKRDNGRVYLSPDEGKTWPLSKILCPGSFACSVLTALPDGTLGCLFEADNANRVVFARFTVDWLTSPCTSFDPPHPISHD